MKNLLPVLLVCLGLVTCAYAQSPTPAAPNLTISAGAALYGGPGLVLSSDSPRAWKRFAVSSGSAGQWSIVSAEHGTGDDGGIYFYTLTVTAGSTAPGPVAPPAPQDTLPIGALTTAVSAAIAGVEPGTVTAAAAGYERLAKQVDAGAITSPTQLYLSLGVETLALTADQRAAIDPLTNAVKTWLNAQQAAGKLDDTKMPDYARVFHAIAKALSGGYIAATVTPHLTEPALAPNSPCANGKCPAQQPAERPHRWHLLDR